MSKGERRSPGRTRTTPSGEGEPPRGIPQTTDAPPSADYQLDVLTAITRHDAQNVLTALLEAAVAAIPRDRRARLASWFDDVKATYVAQCLDPAVGPTVALAQLQSALRSGVPKQSRSVADDERMVRLRDELLEKLAPSFPPQRTWRSLKARDDAIRPIVESILDRPVSGLPIRERLDWFVTELLDTEYEFSVVRRSRAAGRQRQREQERRERQTRWQRIPLTKGMLDTLKALEIGEQFVAGLRHDGASLVLRPSLTDPGAFVLTLEPEPPSSSPATP